MIWNCRIFKHYWPYNVYFSTEDSKYFGFIKIQNDFVSIANFICALLNAISTLQHILPIKHIGSFSSHNKPVFFYSQSFIIPLPFFVVYTQKDDAVSSPTQRFVVFLMCSNVFNASCFVDCACVYCHIWLFTFWCNTLYMWETNRTGEIRWNEEQIEQLR